MENRRIKVLAIDDNRDNLITLKALMIDLFSEVEVLSSLRGKEGLQIAAEEDPDVIFLDIIMPEMDGFEVCNKLKADEKLRDIPVVFFTAIKGDKENRIKALECGAEAFLSKPIDEIELMAQVRAMLKIREANIQKRYEKEVLSALVKEKTKELSYLSYHDHLTGLHNRRFFENEILNIDTMQNLPLSVIMCDVNGLKIVNDSFGHSVGDTLLVKTAEVIRKACREYDTIARIGGDEFIIIMPKTKIDESVKIANQIKELALNEMVANIELSISYGYDTKTTIDQSILEIISNAENHMYRHKLHERTSLRSKTIDLIMSALFEKSNREASHSKRVGALCEAIALKMKLSRDSVNSTRIAGLIHDIGKIGIDEKILNKSEKLTADERKTIEKHPEIGWRVLSSTNEFSELAQFVLSHHEHWDGSGYPNRLKGEAIPLEARIISVADAYDAMTSERSYKKGLSVDEAVNELIKCSGSQFDPRIVNVFVNEVLPDIQSIHKSSHDLNSEEIKEVSFG